MARRHRAFAAWMAQTWGLGPALLTRGPWRVRWVMLKMLVVNWIGTFRRQRDQRGPL